MESGNLTEHISSHYELNKAKRMNQSKHN